jgi:hypothetical protein
MIDGGDDLQGATALGFWIPAERQAFSISETGQGVYLSAFV